MKRHFLNWCFIATIFATQLFAQDCGTHEILERQIQQQPHLREHLLNLEKERVLKQAYTHSNAKTTATLYTIPVVVHLVHNNGPENLTDIQVQNAIDLANKMFRFVAPWNGAGGADSEIQFCLAKQDPLGNATSGINRIVDATKTNHIYFSGAVDIALKNLIRWDPTKYINIWVVKDISGPVAGYAYLASAHGAAYDGIVIEYGHLATNSLTHELGHYFNLQHTFNSGCPNNDCQLDGDYVCDTPPVGSSSGCTRNSCATDADDITINNPFRPVGFGGIGDQSDQANNYMDYSPMGCRNAFSPGQIDRMRYALTTYRNSLTGSFGCVDPCPAKIAFSLFVPSPATAGLAHTITNGTTNGTSWEWYLNNVLISTSQNFTFTYANGGTYHLKLKASNANISCARDTSFSLNVVCPSMVASFSPDLNPALAGQTITFTNTTTTSLDTTGKNFWYVDGVLISNSKDFSYAITIPGMHTVKLVVGNNSSACTSESSQLIEIVCGAQANFTASAANVAMGTTVTFSNTSTGAISYEWLQNLIPVSTATNYTTSFAAEGDYMISLVANNGICKDTLHQIISVFNPSGCRSNKQNDNWYFGNTAAVNFASGSPVATLASAMNAPEGVATISNGSGNLLFYTDGVTVWDRTHVIMLNGTGLAGNMNASQSALIVQKPGNDTLYYIFTSTAFNTGGTFSYSVVDMNLNGGLGGVIPAQKNVLLTTNVAEKIAATYSANGCDIWVMTHRANNNEFIAFPLSSAGIGAAVSSFVGATQTATKGQLKFSPDGTKISAAHYYQNMEVFDFNLATGGVSNAIFLSDKYGNAYGTEFSPDSKKVYFTGKSGGAQGSLPASVIVQFNLTSGVPATIQASATVVGTYTSIQPSYEGYFGSLQLGKDGKVYATYYDRFNPSYFLHRINAPNIVGAGCNYQQNAVSLSGRAAALGLPAILTSSLNTVDFSMGCSLSNSQEVSFSITSGGSGVDTYYWDFGDPTTGSNNYSDQPGPWHTFSAPGTYTVTLVVKKYCQCATVTKQVTVPYVCTLPADLLSFAAHARQERDLLLWSINEFGNLDRFVLERSINLNDISTVAEITSLKTQNEIEAMVPSELKNTTRYYRIRMYDQDGSQKISDWKSVEAGGAQYLVYPNPASGKVHLVALQGNSTCRVLVYNALGQVVQEQVFENQTILSLVQPDGVYRLVIFNENGVEQHSVVLSR